MKWFAGLMAMMLVGVVQASDVEELYNNSCAACHTAGAAGAPKTGDTEAWDALKEEKTMDELVASVVDGKGAMPPGGMCGDCSEEDFRALTEYMSE